MLKVVDGKVPVRSLKEYLTQDRTLVIPPWQREYSWQTTKEGQVDALLDDLLAFAKDDNAKEYLLGSVILCQDPSTADSGQVQLIDGQQRTLTLSLFFLCARRFIRLNSLVDPNNDGHTRVVHDLRDCITSAKSGVLDSFDPKVVMNQKNANEIISRLFDWAGANNKETGQELFKSADAQTLTQRNLVDVARFIYSQLEDEHWESDKLFGWLEKILSGVKLIELQLDSQSEAISVYDRINNRGMQLNSADLVKNILFQSVPDKDFDEISENWKTTVIHLNECEKRTRMQEPKYLLRAMAGQESGKKYGYDELVTYWKDRLDRDVIFPDPLDPQNKEKRLTLAKIDAIPFSESLVAKSKILSQFAQNKSMTGEPLDAIFPAAEMGSVQHFPVLLAGAHLSGKGVFAHLAEQVNARTMLYILGKERNQIFEAMIPAWTYSVASLPADATCADVNKVFKAHAEPGDELWASLAEQVASWRYTNASDRKKIRAVLAYLSVHLDSALGKIVKFEATMQTRKPKGVKHGWDIEHVMPQKLNKTDVFQQIGNLVLLHPNDNRAASDNHPREKENYYNQCELALTKSISELSNLTEGTKKKVESLYDELAIQLDGLALSDWDASAVAERTKFYSKYFKQALSSHMGI
jgi:uncharacterized protein with ParB-like and HNH nuclease domain